MLGANLTVAPARALVPALRKRFATLPLSRISAAAAHPHRSAVASESRRPVAVSPCETVSEEAATPGSPATLSRFGNLQQRVFRICFRRSEGQLLQNQPCAITGSVTSTPAVIALSRIQKKFAIRNRTRAVRILWTLRIACGRERKRWEEIGCRAMELRGRTSWGKGSCGRAAIYGRVECV